MGSKATQDDNKERRINLEDFVRRVWLDGSFLQWVNPKTQRLNVKEVANKILKTSDISIFSKWAQSYRDDFNEKYRKWRQANSELTPYSDIKGHFDLALDVEAPGAFLEKFMKSAIVSDIDEFDKDNLRIVLNSYQALSCERFLDKIEKLQDRVKELEAQIYRKDKKLAFLAETIEYMKTVKAAEEKHFMGSIRNLYSYDIDMFDSKDKP